MFEACDRHPANYMSPFRHFFKSRTRKEALRSKMRFPSGVLRDGLEEDQERDYNLLHLPIS